MHRLIGIALACCVHIAGSAAAPEDVPEDVPDDTATAARVTDRASVDEIVVTARLRDESARSVPLALSVIEGDTIEDTGNDSLDRLQRLEPSLLLFGFNPRTTSVSLRGLGGNVGLTSDGLEGGVGVFLDDVYLGRVGPAMFELVDVERVEVLRGPQSVLFGRSTSAGAIRIVSKPPRTDTADAMVEASIGNYDYRQLKASISGPFRGDSAAGRLSIVDTSRDGFMQNVRSGEAVHDFGSFASRGQLLIAPGDALTLRLIGDYARQKAACCTVVGIGVFEELESGASVPNGFLARTARLDYVPPPSQPFDRNVDADSAIAANMDQRGVSMRIDWSSATIDVTSITAFRAWDWDPANDGDDTALPVVTVSQQVNRQEQRSQELRIASHGESRLDYVAGLYHFRERVDGYGSLAYGSAAPQWFIPPTSPQSRDIAEAALDGFAARSTSSSHTRSNALFGQITWRMTAALDVSAGLRFTDESRWGGYELRHFAGPDLASLPPSSADAARTLRGRFAPETVYSARIEEDNVSSTATLSYTGDDGMLAYVTASRGHKAGGLNIGNFPVGFDPSVQPETVEHYEVGAKIARLDGSLLLNAALFRTIVADYQTSVVQSAPMGALLLSYVDNIEQAESRGYELDLSWSRGSRFGLTASIAYADAEYISYPNGPCPIEVSLTPERCDLSGQRLPGAPKRSSSLALQGIVPLPPTLELYWRFEYSRHADVYTAVGNSRYSRVPAYDLGNLHLGVRPLDARWNVGIWSRNMFDKEYFRMAVGRSSGWIVGLPGDPRTAGITIAWRL